jgi:hypothetical protein
VRVRETVDPNPDWTRVYEDLYPRYRSLYPALKALDKEDTMKTHGHERS